MFTLCLSTQGHLMHPAGVYTIVFNNNAPPLGMEVVCHKTSKTIHGTRPSKHNKLYRHAEGGRGFLKG